MRPGVAPGAQPGAVRRGYAGRRTHRADLQRVTAEYANYRKRVDRDRQSVNDLAAAAVVSELLPILDDLGRAREHGEYEGALKSVGDQLKRRRRSWASGVRRRR